MVISDILFILIQQQWLLQNLLTTQRLYM